QGAPHAGHVARLPPLLCNSEVVHVTDDPGLERWLLQVDVVDVHAHFQSRGITTRSPVRTSNATSARAFSDSSSFAQYARVSPNTSSAMYFHAHCGDPCQRTDRARCSNRPRSIFASGSTAWSP